MSVDSFSEEYNRAFINTWTDEEKQIFLEKLADFAGRPDREGLKKNFYKLSHYLPNKTTRDCIKYYYLQKTSKSFKDAYKKLEVKYKRTYNLKSKLEKIPKGPVNNNQTSTYEGTRDNHEVFERKLKNDKAEAVIHRGFEGLDAYTDLPADVVPIIIERAKPHHARAQHHMETNSVSSKFLLGDSQTSSLDDAKSTLSSINDTLSNQETNHVEESNDASAAEEGQEEADTADQPDLPVDSRDTLDDRGAGNEPCAAAKQAQGEQCDKEKAEEVQDDSHMELEGKGSDENKREDEDENAEGENLEKDEKED